MYGSQEKFQKLMKQIAEGRKNALEKFNALYGKLIYFAAYSVCRSKYMADEVLNDVLIKIWKISSSIDYIENPDGWLYTIAVNEAKNKIIKEKAETALGLDDVPDRHDGIEEVLAEEIFFSWIKDLSEEEQLIFIYRFLRDLSFVQIAKTLKMPISSVTSKYYRALNKVKEKLEKNN